MPSLTRQPEADDAPAMYVAPVERRGGVKDGNAFRPPEDLLPSGGFLAPAPVPAPPRALALDALRLLRQLRDPDRRPARWSEPAFTREIELVRLHLEPLRSRKALANSFGREAFHMTIDELNRDDPGAVRVAYALRWLELGDGAKGQSWPALLKSPPA